MQRVSFILVCFAILITTTISSQAQGGSIASIIDRRAASELEFTTLQRFIELSDLADDLNTSGSYTLFAPTDAAFERLEGAINYSTDQLLSSQAIVDAVVSYHLIDGRLSSSQLRDREGRVIRTALTNAFMGITVNPRDEIVLNNVVEVTDSDIAASNGLIHEINDVLLNRVINDLLEDEFGAPATATPTPSPTSTPVAEPTTKPEMRSTANIRLLHLAIDAPAFTVQFDDDFIMDTISYEDFTDFTNIPQGIYTARAISLDDNNNFTLTTDLTLLNGDFVTLAIVGSLADDTLDLIAFTDDLSDVDTDEARVTLFNAVSRSPSISLVLDDERIFEGVSYSEREADNLDADTYSVQIVPTRDDETSFSEIDEQAIDGAGLYWFILYGTENAPRVRLLIDDAEQIRTLSLAVPESDTAPDAETTPEAALDSIVELLDAAEEFTFLIQALSNADSNILDILGNANGDAVTFLAPTDQAFENLLATTGLRESQLLRNPDLLDNILRYHIIDDPLASDDFIAASGTSIVTSLDPSQAFFVRATDDGDIFLNGTVEFIETDIRASNGIIHIIDDVLLPLVVLDELDL